MTRWTDFIRQWASDHNITYGCALSQPEMKDAYWEKYPKKMTKKEQAKIDTQQIARNDSQQKLMEIASKAKDQMKAKAEAAKAVKTTAQAKAEAAVKALRALKESKVVKELEPVKASKKTIPGLIRIDDRGNTFRNLTKEELKQNAKKSKAFSIQLLKDEHYNTPEGVIENLNKKSIPELQAIAESIGAPVTYDNGKKITMKHPFISRILEKKGYTERSPAAIKRTEEMIERNKQYERERTYKDIRQELDKKKRSRK